MKIYAFATAALLVGVGTMGCAQTYHVMHYFGTTSTASTDPQAPGEPGVICQSRGGYLFSAGGTQGNPGAAFRVTIDGHYKVVHAFTGSDGQMPAGGLTLGRDGLFYGSTVSGGPGTWGTLYKMHSNGEVTTLHYYSGGDGGNPWAAPIQSVAGNFYGVTHGSFNYGTLYSVSPYGEYKTLHSMTIGQGIYQVAPLVQGTDFWFYGAAIDNAGTESPGNLYRINSSSDFEVLYTFDGTHGYHPAGGLIQATDGNFYGVATQGGTYGAGTVYEMTGDHSAVNVVYNFTGAADGGNPVGGIVQASDGNLYGTTYSGGANGAGVLFRLTLNGTYTVLHNFDSGSGSGPRSALMQHTNGRLYGMTSSGGAANLGVFFSLDAGLPPFVTYLPVYGAPGAAVEVLGQGFTADSQVYFNGVRANSTTVYPTYVKAFVPAGATSGNITVITGNVTLTSNKVFIVRP
jgi:uncharacterized repeat protein (TIGR03803 family)